LLSFFRGSILFTLVCLGLGAAYAWLQTHSAAATAEVLWIIVVLRWCSDVDDNSSTSETKAARRRNSVEVCDALY